MRFVARQQNVKIDTASVTARVGVGPRAAGGFGITADLAVTLTGMDRAVAQQLIETAHSDVCPYSHATRGNGNQGR